MYQQLVSLLVQPPLQAELPGLELTGSGRAPDLDAAIDILEQVDAAIDILEQVDAARDKLEQVDAAIDILEMSEVFKMDIRVLKRT